MTVAYSSNAITEWDAVICKFIIYKSFICTWHRIGLPPVYINIHKGFETDFASIPQFARSFIPVFGKHIQAAIVHDWTYVNTSPETYKMTKLEADTLFLEGMIHLNVDFARRNIMYRAVRIGGTGRWKD